MLVGFGALVGALYVAVQPDPNTRAVVIQLVIHAGLMIVGTDLVGRGSGPAD
jgi:hypothetical protein